MMKKWLSWMLALCLLLSMLPTALMESAPEAVQTDSGEVEAVSKNAEPSADGIEFQLGGEEAETPPETELPEMELPAPEAEAALPDAPEEYIEKSPLTGTSVVLQPNTPVQHEVEVGQAFTVAASSGDVSLVSASSNRKDVVQVDVNNGLVSINPVAPGRVTLNLRGYDKSFNLSTYSLTLMVVESLARMSLLAEGSTLLEIGDALTLYAVGANGASLTWNSSAPAVAKVSGSGTQAAVTAVSSGSAVISAKDTAGNTASMEITVNRTPAALRIVAPTAGQKLVYLSSEDTTTLALQVEVLDDKGAAMAYSGFPFTVTSSKPKIVAVEDDSLTAAGLGSATITVASRVNPSAKATVTLEVVAPESYYGPAVTSKNFPDAAFLNYLQQNIDCPTFGETAYLDANTIARVTELDVGGLGISNLKGIGLFTALKTLRCNENALSSLDLSANTRLEYLDCSRNKLTKLNVSKNTALTSLLCDENSITALDLSANPGLSLLVNDGERDTNTDENDAPVSYVYDLDGNWLILDTKVKLSGVSLGLEINKTAFPDDNFRAYVSAELDTSHNGYLSDTERKNVTWINTTTAADAVNDGGVTSVKGIEQFPNLKGLDVSQEPALTALDVSKNAALESLYLNDTAISSLDLSGNPALKDLRCYNTKLTRLDISKNPGLIAAIQDGTVHPVDGVSTAELHVYQDNELAMDKALTISGASAGLKLDAFQDEAFRACVAATADKNGNGYLSDAEINAVTVISCAGKGIRNLSGVERFKNLEVLECDGNQLAALSLSANSKLQCLTCANNGLKSLDISGCASLSTLDCSGNAITGTLALGGSPLLAAAYKNANPVVKDGRATYEYQAARLKVDATLDVTTVSGPPASLRLIAPAAGAVLYCNVPSGNTLTLTAELKTAKGELTSAPVTWSSDNTGVATVSASGVVTAVAPGSAKITATLTAQTSIKDALTVTVTDPTLPTGLQITGIPDSKTLYYIPGALQTCQLSAVMTTGTAYDAVSGVTWASSKPEVLTVDDNGKVTAVGIGSAAITATAKRNARATASVTLQVVDTTVPEGVQIVNGDQLEGHALHYGVSGKDSFELQAALVPAKGYTTESGLTWQSSAPAVVKVEKTGALTARITCVAAGDGAPVTITATADRNPQAAATYAVTVVDETRPVGIRITGVPAGGKLLLAEGAKTAQLGYTLIAARQDITAQSAVTWESSAPAIASVDKNGLVTAKDIGEVEITVRAVRNVAATDTVKLTVTEPSAPTGIRIVEASKPAGNKLYLKLDELKTVNLRAELISENATASAGSSVAWSSSSTSVATVDKSSGKVTAKGVGATVITVASTRYPKLTDSFELTVSAAEPTVTVTPAGEPVDRLLLADGYRTMKLVAKLSFDGADLFVNKVSWKSQNKKVVTVSSDGMVTAKGAGTCEIVATVDKRWTGRYTVDVVDPTLPQGLRISNGDQLEGGILYLNDTFTLKAELLPDPLLEDYRSLLKSDLTWSSSNKKIVSVDKHGKLTAQRAGEAVITVAANRNKAKAVTTFGVKVIDVTIPTSIRIKTPHRTTLYLNVKGESSAEYSATMTTAYEGVKAVSDQIWTVRDKSVATVKYDKKKGIATITAKKGGRTRVTVTPERNPAISDSFELIVDAALPKVEITNAPERLLLKVDSAKSFQPLVKLTMPSGEVVVADPSQMSWKFSPSKAAAYDKDTGKITARTAALGATATLTYGKNNALRAQCTFDVVDPTQPVGLVVSQTPVKLVIKKSQKGTDNLYNYITVQAEPGYESYVDTDCDFKVKSSKVAEVNKRGVITARGEGTTTVTVSTSNGIKKELTVVVDDHTKPARIVIQNGTALEALLSDKSLKLDCVVYDRDGSVVADPSLQWATDNKNVATVKNGKVTFKSAGTVTIRASLKKNDTVTPASITLTIK